MKAYYIPKSRVDESLKVAPIQGKRNLEPFKSLVKEQSFPLNLLEDVEVNDNEAEIHLHEGDLWLSLEGEATFVCDGELVDMRKKLNKDGTVNERELRGSSIKNGAKYVLRPGDWLWIPAGVPHQHSASGVARLAIIKIPSQ